MKALLTELRSVTDPHESMYDVTFTETGNIRPTPHGKYTNGAYCTRVFACALHAAITQPMTGRCRHHLRVAMNDSSPPSSPSQ
jgi:hypothetical protein